MNWMKLIAGVGMYLFLLVLLVALIPINVEDKTFTCIFKEDGICHYPESANPLFIVLSIILSLIFIVAMALTITSEEKTAYIMSIPEAIRKTTMETLLFINFPPLEYVSPENVRPFEGGKYQMIYYENPFDEYRVHIALFYMMSDYATTTSERKRKEPFMGWLRTKCSLHTARQLLYTQEKDITSQIAKLESELQRRNLLDSPYTEVMSENVENERARMTLPGATYE